MLTTFVLVAALAPPVVAAQGQAKPAPTATVATSHYRTGLQLLAAEYWEDAAESFSKAIDLDPQFALAFYGLGRARMGLKAYVAAVAAFSRCRDLYLAELGDYTANRLAANQRRQEQIFALREAMREQASAPGDAAANQGMVQQLQDQIRDLETLNRATVDLQIRVPAFVSIALGSAYFRSNDVTAAERAYLDAARANPKMGEAYNNLAVVYLLTGRVADAEKAVRDAEKRGFRVSPAFKSDLKAARGR